jgi:hypothetical protein
LIHLPFFFLAPYPQFWGRKINFPLATAGYGDDETQYSVAEITIRLKNVKKLSVQAFFPSA